MLSAIRSSARSPLFGGLIIIALIAAFALFGINDIFRSSGDAAVLVGSERVTVRELNMAYERQLQRIQAQNPRFTREQAEEIGLGNSIVRNLTTQAALDAKSSELGLGLSNKELFESLSSIQAFKNGFSDQFDRTTYLQVLDQNGYRGQAGARLFEAEFTAELVRNQMLSAIFDGFVAPEIMSRARQAYEEEMRTIEAILLAPSLVEEMDDPDDETLTQFIAENAQFFTLPERRRFTLVRVNPEAFSLDVDISEDKLQELYDYKLATQALAENPTRSFEQWSFTDETNAQTAYEALIAGSDADLDAPSLLSDVEAFEVPDTTVSEAVFEMASGDIRLIKGLLGWQLVRVTMANDPVAPSFEEIRADLVSELATDQAADDMYDALGRFEEARTAGQTLEEAALSAGIPVEQFDFVSSSAADENGFRLATLANEEDILANIFELPEGFASDIGDYGEAGHFFARVDEIQPSRLAELDEVRQDVLAFWQVRTTDEALNLIAIDALERANSGEELSAIAQSLGEGATVEMTTTRRGGSAGIFTEQLIDIAFSSPKGLPFPSRAGDQRTHAVVIVTDIIGTAQLAVSEENQSLMSNELNEDAAISFERGLLARYDIREDQLLIDRALGRVDLNLQ